MHDLLATCEGATTVVQIESSPYRGVPKYRLGFAFGIMLFLVGGRYFGYWYRDGRRYSGMALLRFCHETVPCATSTFLLLFLVTCYKKITTKGKFNKKKARR